MKSLIERKQNSTNLKSSQEEPDIVTGSEMPLKYDTLMKNLMLIFRALPHKKNFDLKSHGVAFKKIPILRSKQRPSERYANRP